MRSIQAARSGLADEFSARNIAFFQPLKNDDDGLRGFDVGIVIRRALTANDELPVPGKLFEYMMCGVAMLTCAHPGYREFVEGQGIGRCVDGAGAEAIARAVTG